MKLTEEERRGKAMSLSLVSISVAAVTGMFDNERDEPWSLIGVSPLLILSAQVDNQASGDSAAEGERERK